MQGTGRDSAGNKDKQETWHSIHAQYSWDGTINTPLTQGKTGPLKRPKRVQGRNSLLQAGENEVCVQEKKYHVLKEYIVS